MTDLSDAYSNAAYIPGAETYPPRWRTAAAAFRDGLGQRARLCLPYGAGERHRFDLFLPDGPPAGLAMFIHGGYWLSFGREDWSHLAAGALAHGWAMAMPSYTLAPAARIAEITTEMLGAATAAAAEVPKVPLVVTGHSAGGHLAARLACSDTVLEVSDRLVRVVPISPLADLAPLMRTGMNAKLRIDPVEAAAESPLRHPRRPHVSAHVWVGEAERPAFHYQARLLADAWQVPLTMDPGRHHFDVIDSLEDPASPLCRVLLGPE